jgi:hypothetical protein
MVVKWKEFVSANNCVEKTGDCDFVCICSLEIGTTVPLYRVVHKVLFLS